MSLVKVFFFVCLFCKCNYFNVIINKHILKKTKQNKKQNKKITCFRKKQKQFLASNPINYFVFSTTTTFIITVYPNREIYIVQ